MDGITPIPLYWCRGVIIRSLFWVITYTGFRWIFKHYAPVNKTEFCYICKPYNNMNRCIHRFEQNLEKILVDGGEINALVLSTEIILMTSQNVGGVTMSHCNIAM